MGQSLALRRPWSVPSRAAVHELFQLDYPWTFVAVATIWEIGIVSVGNCCF